MSSLYSKVASASRSSATLGISYWLWELGISYRVTIGHYPRCPKSSLARSSKKPAADSEDIHALEIGNLLDSDHIDVSRHDGSIGARINFRSNEFNYYYIRVNEHSMDSQQKNGQAIIICKQCGSEFSCGSDANSGQCWCHDLPNVMPLTEQARTSEDCYCQQCLEEIISKKITTKP